jgi:hypothetical protein
MCSSVDTCSLELELDYFLHATHNLGRRAMIFAFRLATHTHGDDGTKHILVNPYVYLRTRLSSKLERQ